MHPDVILLNGCSSAGKSSIARRLQKALTPPHVLTGIDDFTFRLLPPQLHGSEEGVWFETTPDGAVAVRFGATGYAMQLAFHRSVAALAESGLSVIVDDVILEPCFLDSWLDVLQSRRVFFIGVRCSLRELERREVARGDRAPGQARSHFDAVHAHSDYDLEVDTTGISADACAERIIAALALAREETAFERLRRRRSPGGRVAGSA